MADKLSNIASLNSEDVVYRLLKRAEIRRKIKRGNGERDRIADLCEEAANEIKQLRETVDYYIETHN